MLYIMNYFKYLCLRIFKLKDIMRRLFLLLMLSVFTLQLSAQNGMIGGMLPTYVCLRATSHVEVDGNIYGKEWENAPWSSDFVDIRGTEFPTKPKYQTRMKMMWDDDNIYVAAEIIEPHIWATLRQRDTTIYYDNDFEMFIDPNGTGHNYFEFEMNAFGTEWDLLMTKPYKFQGTFLNGFDIKGLVTKVRVYGTINDPSDEDQKWCVEMSFPIKSLKNQGIKPGDQWRMNFSRVEWLSVDIVDGQYVKQEGKEGFGHEENWVWAPTGVVDIHRPEYWGFVQFSDKSQGKASDIFVWNSDEEVRFELHRLMDLQREYHKENGTFAKDLKELDYEYAQIYSPVFYPAGDYIVISGKSKKGNIWNLGADGRLWQNK